MACAAWLAAWLWLLATDVLAAKGRPMPATAQSPSAAKPTIPATAGPRDGSVAADTAATADPRTRISWLRAEIARNDELYFRQAAPEISDAEYDRLTRELAALEAAHPALAGPPPERDAAGDGAAVTGTAGLATDAPALLGDDRSGLFPTWRHGVPMLGLDKAYTAAELRAFLAKVGSQTDGGGALVLEPKYDGVAVSATYGHGRLVRLATRGDGREGDDVTANAGVVAGLPAALRTGGPKGPSPPFPELVELRGEVYVGDAEFARINAGRVAAGEEPFAHPRSLAAGTLKSLDPGVRASRRLAVVIYGWGEWRGSGEPASQQALHELVRAWGLPAVGAVRVVSGWEETWAAVEEFRRARESWAFPADGVVLKVDAVAARRRLGDGPAAPNWAVAYKFPPVQAATRLRGITVQVGRSGVLTPVAELEPVQLAGTTVTRATLHNPHQIARRDLRVGDTVLVERAGDVIPAIVGVDLARRPASAAPFVFPANCPECGAVAVAEPGAASMRCPNGQCPAQVRRRVEHFAAAVGIRGLGPATIGTLVAAGRLRSIADLYRLRREELVRLDGIGATTAGRLLAEIERSRGVDLWRLVAGLGLPGVGPATARRLAAGAPDLGTLLRQAATSAGEARPAGGPARMELVVTPPARAMIEELLVLGVNPRSRPAASAEEDAPAN